MQSEQQDGHGRLYDLVRRRWDKLDWKSPLPSGKLVVTEAHYMNVDRLRLTESARQQLNRSFACFTCELFIHFERYVIEFLEHRGQEVTALPQPAIDRFVAEEKVHSEAFYRLLCKLRPDLYSERHSATTGLRFMHWNLKDELVVALSPVGSFFLLAWLFEEITLFVPIALDQHPEQCAPLLAEVMRLHAKEEQPHVALDTRVLLHKSKEQSWLLTSAETLLTLPLLAYADGRARTGWLQVLALAEMEFGLTPLQRHLLLHRGPSQSDRMGMASFADKVDKTTIPAASFLAWILRLQLRSLAPL